MLFVLHQFNQKLKSRIDIIFKTGFGMSSKKIVTTPMCEEILKLAGIKEYSVSSNPHEIMGDIIITLSETKTCSESIKIKLNTFSQITESIEKLSEIFNTTPLNYSINDFQYNKIKKRTKKIKIKVYSHFLKEIVEDMGFTVVHDHYDYIVFPDYMKDKILCEIKDNVKGVEVPSHNKVPLDPIKRAEMRYNFLEKSLCTKH